MKLKYVFLFSFGLIIIWLSVSCQSGTKPTIATSPPVTVTSTTMPQSSLMPPSTDPVPTATATIKVEKTSDSVLEPTLLPTETTEAATSIPTVALLKKVDELPISGTGLVVSRDGSLLAVSNTNTGVLYVFDMAMREVKWELEEDSRTMTGYTALSFSPNGNLLAGGGVNQDVFVWNMDSGELLFSLPVPHDVVDDIVFSQNGQFLAVSSFQTPTPNVEVTLWDMQTGQLANTYSLTNTAETINQNIGDDAQSESPTWSIRDIAFLSEQDKVLAITIEHHFAQEDYTALYFWDIGNQGLTEVLTGIYGKTLAVSPNGQLLVAEIDDHLQVLDIPNKTNLLDIDLGSAALTTRLAISDMGILSRLERGGGVTLWNSKGDLLTMLEIDKTISNIVFTPNGELVVASYVENDDAPIEIWEVNE